jgi:rRNA maturation endonuclease Nob1
MLQVKPQTKLILDRTRNVEYNGSALKMNSFKCASCKKTYTFEEVSHEFCPFCGVKYLEQVDVSL